MGWRARCDQSVVASNMMSVKSLANMRAANWTGEYVMRNRYITRPETEHFGHTVSPFVDGKCNFPAYEGRIDPPSFFIRVAQ